MIKVLEIPGPKWIEEYSEFAHKIVFNRLKPKSFDRIDYALLVVHVERDTPLAYVTVRETDHETVYWQFGGGLWGQKSILMARSYDAMLQYQAKKCQRMWTRIENDNWPMLKLALSRRLKICGVFVAGKTTLIEMLKEWTTDGDELDVLESLKPNARDEETAERDKVERPVNLG